MSKKPKPEKHHWWPKGVSEFWKDSNGLTRMIRHGQEDVKSNPKNFGVIGGGHHIKLNKHDDKPTPWDECFEGAFQYADDNLPNTIRWLETLERRVVVNAPNTKARLLAQEASEDQIRYLIEGLVSLVVRSPKFRECAVAIAERLRGPLPVKERLSLIGANMRHCQRMIADHFGTRGKFAAIYSPDREFIFGDGFYTTINSTSAPPFNARILVPLTPDIAVFYCMPPAYNPNPQLSTLVISADEAKSFNDAVQVYSKDCLFYKNERPEIIDAFRRNEHLVYQYPDPFDQLASDLSGNHGHPLLFP